MATLDLLTIMSLVATGATSISAMQWEKRVLLISASNVNDRSLIAQRNIVARWKLGAEGRDLAVVEIVGDKVIGASEPAATLRQRYRLPVARFVVILIGKDGGTKLRETRTISAAVLEKTIDAMPMRRAGGR